MFGQPEINYKKRKQILDTKKLNKLINFKNKNL